MLSKFSKNAIYSGIIDYYCLVCEEYLKTQKDVEAHIEKKVHKKDLDSTPYFEDNEEECIRKIKSEGYYCEICNDFISTAPMAKLHIADSAHKSNKSKKSLITRVNNTIIAKDVYIDEKAWNGFADNTCYICNIEFNDVNIHKRDRKHIRNLIQSKVECGDGAFYRKVSSTNQELFHCLTCHDLVSGSHFNSKPHIEQYKNCLVNRTPSTNKTDTEIISVEKNASIVQETKEKPVDEVKQIKKKDKKKKTVNNNTNELDEYVCNRLGAKNYVADKDGKQWCLLCDWILEDHTVGAHLKSQHHATMLKMHKARLAKKNGANQKELEDSDAESTDANASKDAKDETEAVCDKLLDSTSQFERNNININLESRTAYCKKCSKNIDFEYEHIKNHIEEHQCDNKQTEKTNKEDKNNNAAKGTTLITKPVTMKQKHKEEKPVDESDDEALVKFAKKNDLIWRNNRYYCSVCSISLRPILRTLEDHISGIAHKNRVYRQSKPLETKLNTATKVPLKTFIHTMNVVENMFFKDFVINDKYCINILSFYTFTRIGSGGLRCHICEETFGSQEADVHKVSDRHACKMEDALVITSIDGEFVRQVKSGLFHCGFCNLVLDEDDMLDHLKCTSHEENKRSATNRLEKYLPQVMQQRQADTMGMMFMEMLKNRLPF